MVLVTNHEKIDKHCGKCFNCGSKAHGAADCDRPREQKPDDQATMSAAKANEQAQDQDNEQLKNLGAALAEFIKPPKKAGCVKRFLRKQTKKFRRDYPVC